MNGKNTSITKNKLKKVITKRIEWDFNVSDNKNDILKITSLTADGFINDYEIKDNAVNARVTLKANMLYIPDVPEDYEPKLSCLESTENAVIKADLPNSDWDLEDVQLIIKNASPELLNSRKAGARVTVGLVITLIKNKEIACRMPEDVHVETEKRSINAIHIPIMLSEKINFSHTFTIPSGKPDIKEILRCSAMIKNKEVKAVTGKAVFKGNLEIKILYISTQNTVECFEANIPFTEIADAKGLSEDMEMILSACAKDVSVKVYANESNQERNVDASGYMLFNLTAFMRNEIEIITDAFCPEHKDECIREEINYSDIGKPLRDAYTLKETVYFDEGDMTEICDVSANIVNKEAVLSDGKVNITSDVIFDIVYKSMSGIKCERKVVTFDFSQEADSMNYDAVDLGSEITNCSYMITSANSIELRCNILFETRLSKEETVNAVTEIKADKTARNAFSRAPIVTYYPMARENLFNIAKKYKTTVESLKEVNSLTSDYAEAGTFLIIE